jgi:hypothetical protein
MDTQSLAEAMKLNGAMATADDASASDLKCTAMGVATSVHETAIADWLVWLMRGNDLLHWVRPSLALEDGADRIADVLKAEEQPWALNGSTARLGVAMLAVART